MHHLNTVRFFCFCSALMFCIMSVVFACRSQRSSLVTDRLDRNEQRNTPPVSHSPPLFDAITTLLGDRWKVFRQNDEWIVERRKLPIFHNTCCANPHDMRLLSRTQDPEVRSLILEKYRSNISYRIVIRNGPPLGEAEVDRRLQANLSIKDKLDSLKAEGVVLSYKMPIENQTRVQEIWETAEDIPCGIYQDRSIYMYLTHFGVADTDPTSHKDYYTAALGIAQLLLPYKSVRLRRGPKDPRWWSAPDHGSNCTHNPFSPLKPVACPW